LENEVDLGEVSLSIDNQAVIKATGHCHAKLGQELIDKILEVAERLKREKGEGYSLTVHWIPGHSDIEGNELVDKGAKEAAEGKVSKRERLPDFVAGRTLPSSVSAMHQHQMKSLRKEWTKQWSKSPCYNRLHNIDADLPSRKSTKKITALSKGLMSIIVQLHTGHAPLNAHLFKIKKSDTELCPRCRDALETVHHFLFDCISYGHERHKRYMVLWRDSDSLSFLLSDLKGIRELGLYVNRTRRFRHIFGEIGIPDSE
jgi:hypothetical protein